MTGIELAFIAFGVGILYFAWMVWYLTKDIDGGND